MKILSAIDFFAGKWSFTKVARELGLQVTSLDYDYRHKCDITMDILDFFPGDFPHIKPDIIWASPDCTSFSFASAGFHRSKNGDPKTEKAILWDKLLKKLLSLLEVYLSGNPKIVFYIENPRGHMAKRPYFIKWLKNHWCYEHMITYCSYWGKYRKPTNIWTNNPKWRPRARCGYKFVDPGIQLELVPETICKHEMVERCSNRGISSIWKAWDPRRSVIPELLFFEIIASTPGWHISIDETWFLNT